MKHVDSYIANVWDYMIEQGVLDRTAADELQERCAADRVPLGKILVLEKLITVAQLMHTLEVTDERPHMRFGDIVVSEGYCTRDEVEACIAIQRRKSRDGVELLLESPHYRRGPLFAALGEYINMMESRVRRLSARVDELEAGSETPR